MGGVGIAGQSVPQFLLVGLACKPSNRPSGCGNLQNHASAVVAPGNQPPTVGGEGQALDETTMDAVVAELAAGVNFPEVDGPVGSRSRQDRPSGDTARQVSIRSGSMMCGGSPGRNLFMANGCFPTKKRRQGLPVAVSQSVAV